MSSKTKQVLVLRKDLHMRKGKMIAQGAHAAMKVILDMMVRDGEHLTLHLPPLSAIEDWLNDKFTKIGVYVNSEEELLALHTKAKEEGVPCSLILDSGATEFNGVPTYTALAVGPAFFEDVDKVTGGLPTL